MLLSKLVKKVQQLGLPCCKKMAVYIVGYVHYYMERDRILHGKCGHTVFMHELLMYSVSEIEQVSTANK